MFRWSGSLFVELWINCLFFIIHSFPPAASNTYFERFLPYNIAILHTYVSIQENRDKKNIMLFQENYFFLFLNQSCGFRAYSTQTNKFQTFIKYIIKPNNSLQEKKNRCCQHNKNRCPIVCSKRKCGSIGVRTMQLVQLFSR